MGNGRGRRRRRVEQGKEHVMAPVIVEDGNRKKLAEGARTTMEEARGSRYCQRQLKQRGRDLPEQNCPST
jgi:hypothetical protein